MPDLRRVKFYHVEKKKFLRRFGTNDRFDICPGKVMGSGEEWYIFFFFSSAAGFYRPFFFYHHTMKILCVYSYRIKRCLFHAVIPYKPSIAPYIFKKTDSRTISFLIQLTDKKAYLRQKICYLRFSRLSSNISVGGFFFFRVENIKRNHKLSIYHNFARAISLLRYVKYLSFKYYKYSCFFYIKKKKVTVFTSDLLVLHLDYSPFTTVPHIYIYAH